MMMSIQSYVRRGRHTARVLALDPRVRSFARAAAWFGAGLILSAASLANSPQPITLGFLCAASGWNAVLVCFGGAAGYWLFWGAAGMQGIVWLALGLPCALLLGKKRIRTETKLLMSAIAALIVSGAGVLFQNLFADDTTIPVYLLRVALAAFTARVFEKMLEQHDPVVDWLVWGIAVLALAQIVPAPYLGFGFLAAGALGAVGSFPAAALAGLALDVAQVTQTPMAAVMCLTYFVRLIPKMGRWAVCIASGAVYMAVSALCGVWDLTPVPALMLGGVLGQLFPKQSAVQPRRGETGVAQVRLEVAAGAMAQAQQVLLEVQAPPIDEEALIQRAVQQACADCPCRKTCRDMESLAHLSTQFLHMPLPEEDSAKHICRKSGRVLNELRRSRMQYRTLRADRERQQEYRDALTQQYQFLADYLRELADALPARGKQVQPRFRVEASVRANHGDADNGDRCLRFAGTGCRYYVVLCDGMGRGIGAAAEGEGAGRLLQRLLCAGFPAVHALRSLNSLCALRDRAGAATVDLAELELDTGRVVLYKWGAAPSYLVSSVGVEKIGTTGSPPGLSVADGRETMERLSLRRGETLVMLSDGVGGEKILHDAVGIADAPLGEVAAQFLANGDGDGTDDATVVAVRLSDLTTATV